MFYFGLQIILLLLFLIALGTLVKNKFLRFFVVFGGGVFFVLQLVSLAFNGGLINYRFYEQIDFGNIWSVKGFFLLYIILFIGFFVALLFLLNYLVKTIKKSKIKSAFLIGTLVVAGACLFLPRGIGANIYEIAKIKSAKTRSFHSALEQLGVAPEKYVPVEEIEAEAGKNIIVLSLESLERGYLGPSLEELTPNLNALAKKHAFIKMGQQYGASWTSASIYTMITGVPAYFKSSGGNTIFQHTTSTKIGNLGSVLQVAGYDMSYLISKKNFAGMGDMLKTFGFEVKSDDDFNQNYRQTHWGIHDKDMFAELKKEILVKKGQGRPFAVFLSTISGHFPHGIYDERMESVLPPCDNPLEFMASAVDYYIGDLFDFLKKNNLLENTEVFIFPDHQLMGSTSKVIEKFAKPRGLYVITTAEKNKTLQGLQKPILQMDLPRMIINGAGIQTNATFLSAFIKGNKLDYLKEHRREMLALNEAALDRNSYREGMRLEISSPGMLELSALENPLKEQFKMNGMLNEVLFTDDLRFLSQREIPHNETNYPPLKTGYYAKEIKRVFDTPTKYALIYSISGDSIYAYLQKGDYIGTTRKGKGAVTFSKNDIAALTGWTMLKEGLEIKADEIFLKSTGWESISSFNQSRIYLGFKPMQVKRGINLLYVDNNSYKVFNTDTFADEAETEKFLKKLENLTEAEKLVAIVVHDASIKKLSGYSEQLENLGFPELAELEYRQPYIATFQNGAITEMSGITSLRESIPLKEFPNPELEAIKRDTMRFIAHAGGAINGETYTNSLEAMNLSYKKGFRLFELDIIKTTDGVFVAAHDWKHWSGKTGYAGKIPVSLETFKENPIKDYTPMDINDINRWFKKHPDAILITDKVNDPEAFSKVFIDKDRLMMELFSLEAAKEAQKLGIKVLLSENVLRKLDGKELETLQNLGIQRIAISRRIIKDNLGLLKKLKKAGIKTYVFHLYNQFDENYVLTYEIDYIYGMYADEWDFGAIKEK
ncbi:MAG TPA: sulfatase-like hydrolase/transferase [Flavobacteriaceae bacterium]|nr:sulfatase-like hydrolase/transferase [Flavobacteriaceae bacterium]